MANNIKNVRINQDAIKKNKYKKFKLFVKNNFRKVIGVIILSAMVFIGSFSISKWKNNDSKFILPNITDILSGQSNDDETISENIGFKKLINENADLLTKYDEIKDYVLLLGEFEKQNLDNEEISIEEYKDVKRLSSEEIAEMLIKHKKGVLNDEEIKQLLIQLGLINYYLSIEGYDVGRKMLEIYVADGLAMNLTNLGYNNDYALEIARYILKDAGKLTKGKKLGEKPVDIDFSKQYVELHDKDLGNTYKLQLSKEGERCIGLIFEISEAQDVNVSESKRYKQNNDRIRVFRHAFNGIAKRLKENEFLVDDIEIIENDIVNSLNSDYTIIFDLDSPRVILNK